MTTPSDGGPAYPVGSGDMRDPTGMSLRDYFAGQALAGIYANPNSAVCTPAEYAAESYVQADAMLAAREAGR